MATGVVKLALLAFFARVAGLHAEVVDTSCEASTSNGDSECQATKPRKSGSAMLQYKMGAKSEEDEGVEDDGPDDKKKKGKKKDKTKKDKTKTGKDKKKDKTKKGTEPELGEFEVEETDYYDPDIGDVEVGPKMYSSSTSTFTKMNMDKLPHPTYSTEGKGEVPKAEWIGEDVKDGLVKMETIEYTEGVEAEIFVPQCKPPTNGFAAVVHVPGRANFKGRHTWEGWMLGRRGVIFLNLDIVRRMTNIFDAIDFLKSAGYSGKYPVDPSKITVMGYSLGANATLAHNLHPKGKEVAGTIEIAGISCDVDINAGRADAPPLLAIEAVNDGFKRPSTGSFFEKNCADRLAPGEKPRDKVTQMLTSMDEKSANKVHLLFYGSGGHHPFLNGEVIYEMAKFAKDPAAYESPESDWKATYANKDWRVATAPAVWEHKAAKGCTYESKKIDEIVKNSPGLIMMANLWGGNTAYVACMMMCKGIKGCVAVELFKAKIEGYNCALLSSVCDNPTNWRSQLFTWEGYDGPCDDGQCTEISTETWVPPITIAPVGPSTQSVSGESVAVNTPAEPAAPSCAPQSFYISDEPCTEQVNAAECASTELEEGPYMKENTKNAWMGGCYFDTRYKKVYFNTTPKKNPPQSFQKYVCKICVEGESA